MDEVEEIQRDAGIDAERAARWNKVRGFLVHLAAFAAVMLFLGVPFWGLFWGIGVVSHALATLPALYGLLRASAPPAELPVVEEEPEADEFVHTLRGALAALERSGEPVEGLEEEALALHGRCLALAEVVGATDTSALRQERDQALAQAQASADVLEREAHTARAEAITEHLDALEDAGVAHRRLFAQEQALLHQLAGLRLGLARRAAGQVEEGHRDSLRILRETLSAESEVDDHLARARAHARERAR